jgi:hypothetical protein
LQALVTILMQPSLVIVFKERYRSEWNPAASIPILLTMRNSMINIGAWLGFPAWLFLFFLTLELRKKGWNWDWVPDRPLKKKEET